MRDRESPYISLSDSVHYRKEYFGGILFNTRTGTMMDVDREVYLLVELIKTMGVVDVNDLDMIWFNLYDIHLNRRKVIRIIENLLELKMLVVMPNGLLHKENNDIFNHRNQNTINWPLTQFISAPETVHWAITFQCDLDCLDCYVRRHRDDFPTELDTKQALTIVDRIADAGVFQLAIGGGEPLLRDDIISIVARAHERKLVVHVTTGRYQHELNVLRKLAKYIKSMQIGIKQEELLEHPENEKKKLIQLLAITGEQGIDIGANVILSHSTLSEFDHIIDLLATAGFKRITLLRYKPPGNLNRWVKEKPNEDTLLEFERKLLKTMDTYPHIQFRVDCGLAFLERSLPSQTAVSNGIRGCTAADRILSIAPDGMIFPCSQLVGKEFSAGNLLEDELKSFWINNKVLRRYRNFRNNKAFKSSHCGQCAASTHCGGCRVFAEDALGADPGCPAPVLSQAKLRKYGKFELSDTIADIQESIGFTEGGFPYATFEEIQGWLEEEDGHGYPQWLIRKSVKRRDQF
ncbi:MAG: radical SAM protein [Desulfitobacteriaceae bacterium]